MYLQSCQIIQLLYWQQIMNFYFFSQRSFTVLLSEILCGNFYYSRFLLLPLWDWALFMHVPSSCRNPGPTFFSYAEIISLFSTEIALCEAPLFETQFCALYGCLCVSFMTIGHARQGSFASAEFIVSGNSIGALLYRVYRALTKPAFAFSANYRLLRVEPKFIAALQISPQKWLAHKHTSLPTQMYLLYFNYLWPEKKEKC